MSLLALRTAIDGAVKAALPTVKSVKPHGGRFTLEEIRRIAAQTPSVRIALLGLNSIGQTTGSEVRALAVVAVFVLTRDAPAVHRDVAALALVEVLVKLVPGNVWGLADVDAPNDVRADNLFSTQLDKVGVALWAVNWRQEIELGVFDETALDDFATFNATFDIGETPNTPKTDIQIEGLDQ